MRRSSPRSRRTRRSSRALPRGRQRARHRRAGHQGHRARRRRQGRRLRDERQVRRRDRQVPRGDGRALGFSLEELAAAALRAERASTISSMCTVFAESEVTGLVHRGEDRGAIARGLHESIASGRSLRSSAWVQVRRSCSRGGSRRTRRWWRWCAAGSAATCSCRVRRDDSQIVGAYGAALCAQGGPSDGQHVADDEGLCSRPRGVPSRSRSRTSGSESTPRTRGGRSIRAGWSTRTFACGSPTARRCTGVVTARASSRAGDPEPRQAADVPVQLRPGRDRRRRLVPLHAVRPGGPHAGRLQARRGRADGRVPRRPPTWIDGVLDTRGQHVEALRGLPVPDAIHQVKRALNGRGRRSRRSSRPRPRRSTSSGSPRCGGCRSLQSSGRTATRRPSRLAQ